MCICGVTTIKTPVYMSAYDNLAILFNQRAYHGMKTKPGSEVVSQSDLIVGYCRSIPFILRTHGFLL